MRFAPGSDDPVPQVATGVRPFLQSGAPYERPAGEYFAPAHAEHESPGEQTTALRPFVITSGRVTAADPAIGMETQVTLRPGVVPDRLSPEQRAIVGLCQESLSVAEISARLKLHLGVTRILVSDLHAAGYLDVHVLDDEFPDPDTIMRVIRGLRAL